MKAPTGSEGKALELFSAKHKTMQICNSSPDMVDVNDDRRTNEETCPILPYNVSKTRIYDAECLLFDDRKLKQKKVDECVAKYSDRALNALSTPEAISAIIQDSLQIKGNQNI
ncbi:hypothetical protein G7Y89_g4401 [Cudoniella acicularis]|uniref:Uncharacterized protein n=1 Tax=Cudoniella acicularis TaxID=354080 RepID=A0A8H4RRN5_9HELO|nr:hypothetical protein G7Y89_g4401 [Cudoniella acicularis]